ELDALSLHDALPISMKAQWQRERELIKHLRGKKEKLEQLKAEAERLQRQGDYARASELRFGSIPALENDIASDTAQVDELRGARSEEHTSELQSLTN